MPESGLPSFKNPPVVETVLGVQFEPVRGLSAGHLGAFWKRINQDRLGGTDWPHVAEAPALEPEIETFDPADSWSRASMRFKLGPPSLRLQIRNSNRDAMVQVQDNRLHYNWIGGQDGKDYRRYARVRPAFDAAYTAFLSFLKDEGLKGPTETQWEVTYVNHIPKSTVWNEPADWAGLFNDIPGAWRAPEGLLLESAGGSWHFEIQPRKGRLHVNIKHATLTAEPSTEILRLTYTARGPVNMTDDAGRSVGEGLDLGHETIVRAFRDMTSPGAHRYWEIEQ